MDGLTVSISIVYKAINSTVFYLTSAKYTYMKSYCSHSGSLRHFALKFYMQKFISWQPLKAFIFRT